ncbi:MrpH family fimbial adhesin [Aeromonas simiae]|uniref:Fimbrial adhesin MrpH C-terminal domain-containing protein n=1 Tax=Aeromonas simiae TaxID=218936 RepID=A0A5J6WXG8_9GAMM|nr:hypothetical protein [Aeromonas simiae]QFI54453.1 hypothetical protein FE240_06940 [Aeromonas simiae]
MRKTLLLAMLLAITPVAKALVYQWPVISHIEVDPAMWGETTIYFKSHTFNAPSWPDDITYKEALTQVGYRPNQISSSAYGGIIGNLKVGTTNLIKNIVIDTSRKLTTVSQQLTQLIGGSYSAWMPSYQCFFVGGSHYEGWGSAWGGDPYIMYGDCISPPPAGQYCSMENTDLDFNFGYLVSHHVNGKSMTKNVNIYCTSELNFTMRMVTGGSVIHTDSGINANVTLNGESITNKPVINGVKGGNQVSVGVTLAGTPTTTGAFSGSGTLVIAYF